MMPILFGKSIATSDPQQYSYSGSDCTYIDISNKRSGEVFSFSGEKYATFAIAAFSSCGTIERNGGCIYFYGGHYSSIIFYLVIAMPHGGGTGLCRFGHMNLSHTTVAQRNAIGAFSKANGGTLTIDYSTFSHSTAENQKAFHEALSLCHG
jgi:hypothetical protein